jgi:hypothetical protein
MYAVAPIDTAAKSVPLEVDTASDDEFSIRYSRTTSSPAFERCGQTASFNPCTFVPGSSRRTSSRWTSPVMRGEISTCKLAMVASGRGEYPMRMKKAGTAGKALFVAPRNGLGVSSSCEDEGDTLVTLVSETWISRAELPSDGS